MHRDRLDGRRAGDPAVGHDDAPPADGAVEQRAAAAGGVLAHDVVEQPVGPVVGRTWSAATKPPPCQVGSHRTRSAKARSESRVQSATRRAQVVEVGLGQVGALARDVVEPGHARKP